MADTVIVKPEAPPDPAAAATPPVGEAQQVSDTVLRVEANAAPAGTEKPTEAPPKAPEEPPKATEAPKALTPAEAEATATKAGLSMQKLAEEYAATGSLTAESLAALEKAGVTKADVDTYIAGQKAIAEQYTADLATAVGGKESLDRLLKWAGTELTKPEVEAANRALASMDPAQAKLVLQGLQARYTAKNGAEPRLVTAEAAPASASLKPYASTAELTKAMGDPRYAKDPAYRAQVERRLAISDLF